MSMHFPLFLVLATGLAGLAWLVDIFFLRPRRRTAVSNIAARANSNIAAEAVTKPHLLVDYAIQFFPVLLVVLILRSFLVEPFQIPSGSMIPTLKVGDFILVNKFSYGIRLPVIGTKILNVGEPKNGDVMVFIPPHQNQYFIKRVIGIPGDKVRYEDKALYLNGVQQPQKFIAQIPPKNPRYLVYEETLHRVKHLIHKNGYSARPAQKWVIPQGHYLMMGDNRDRSSDSRVWGLVSKDNIVGKAFAVWMHKKPGWHWPTFSTKRWIK